MPTVLITGANRGIGLEFVRQYAADQWRVHACCRNPGGVGDLKAIKGDIVIHALDVSDPAAIRALAKTIDEPLDIIIANAGAGGWDIPAFGDYDYGAWAALMQVNLYGAVATVEAFAPHAKRRKEKSPRSPHAWDRSTTPPAPGGCPTARRRRPSIWR